MTIKKFQKLILDWYKHNRRDMPWRNTKNPYRILVSEIMLQQTQISRVLPKYKEFLLAFPNLRILARARIKRLLKVWNGLGYWRRALFLKETAKKILKEYGGKFPRDPKELEKLPGIGPYTARALACFAFGNTEAFLDTNIRRAYLYFFFKNRSNVPDADILTIAQQAVSNLHHGEIVKLEIDSREWHYALFDYGALVLNDKKINQKSRHYHTQSKFEGSFRSFRTQVVRFLLSHKRNRASQTAIEKLLKDSPYPPDQIISSLVQDNLIKQSNGNCSL